MFYVTMTDTFMSGWELAKDRINKFVIACDNYSQAEEIAKEARKRPEMKYIRIYSEIHWE